MMNLLPRHFASTLAGLVLLGMLLMLSACDDDTVAPRVTVPEIDQPQPAEVLLEVPTDEAAATSDEITVEYRGLDSAPEIEVAVDGPGSLDVTGRSNSGDPFEGGTTTFALAFSNPGASVLDPSEATVTISGGSAELNRSVSRTINVEAQKILPEITASTTSLGLEIPEGEAESQTRELVVSYRALDEVPTFTIEGLEGPGTFNIEQGTAEGSAEEGSTPYLITYASDNIAEETTASLVFTGANATVDLEESLTVSLTGSGELSGVDGQAGVLTDFLNVADYEERSTSAFGGATATVVEMASQEASGSKSLSLMGGVASGVVLGNTVSLAGADRFTFYARGDENRIVDLVWTFRDDAGNEAEFIQSLERNQPWLFFEVPAAEAGLGDLSGTLAEVEIEIGRVPAGATVEVLVDDLSFGDADGTILSFFDFDDTTNPYIFGGASNGFTMGVAAESAGTRARTYTGEGGGFGFNYNVLRLPEADLATDVLQLRIGAVSDDFTLFIFLETRGFVGGFTFDNGIETGIVAGAEWQTIEVPLSEFGDDPSALIETNDDGALSNVGFEIRNASDEVTFALDDIVIRRGN